MAHELLGFSPNPPLDEIGRFKHDFVHEWSGTPVSKTRANAIWLYGFTAVACAIIFGTSAGRADARPIISEDFNRPNNTTMTGLAPDLANLPGGVFSVSTTFYPMQTHANQLQIGADISLNVPLGAYDAGLLHMSADVSLDTLLGSLGGNNRGVGLGFQPTSNGGWTTFTGLKLTPDGYLMLQSNQINLGAVFVGTSNSSTYHLSYDVDVGTGVMSAISLQGISANFSSLVTASAGHNYFSGNPYASVFVGGTNAGQIGIIDNFAVSDSIPEPASSILLGSSIVGLGVMRRRARRRAS